MKIGPNDLIYPLVNFHIFPMLLTIFPDLISFLCVWKRLNPKSEIIFYFLPDRTRKTRPDSPLQQTCAISAHMPAAHLLYSAPHSPLGRVPPRSSPIPRVLPARSDRRRESRAQGVPTAPPHVWPLVIAVDQSVSPFLRESRHSSTGPAFAVPRLPNDRRSPCASHPARTSGVRTSLRSDRCIPQRVSLRSPNQRCPA
jgi:hypothetical protein